MRIFLILWSLGLAAKRRLSDDESGLPPTWRPFEWDDDDDVMMGEDITGGRLLRSASYDELLYGWGEDNGEGGTTMPTASSLPNLPHFNQQ